MFIGANNTDLQQNYQELKPASYASLFCLHGCVTETDKIYINIVKRFVPLFFFSTNFLIVLSTNDLFLYTVSCTFVIIYHNSKKQRTGMVFAKICK